MKIPKGKKFCFFSSALYKPGSHLRVEERVSGGGGAIHYNTQPSSALQLPAPFLQRAGGTRDGKFATGHRKLQLSLVEKDRELFRGSEKSHIR